MRFSNRLHILNAKYGMPSDIGSEIMRRESRCKQALVRGMACCVEEMHKDVGRKKKKNNNNNNKVAWMCAVWCLLVCERYARRRSCASKVSQLFQSGVSL
jgi:hypothetical protein